MTDNPTTSDASVQTGAEPKASGTALDALLAEFSAKTGKPENLPTNGAERVLGELKPVIDYARTQQEREVKADIDKTIGDAIKFVKEDEALAGLPDKVIRGLLHDYAGEKDQFQTAFLNRHKDAAAWQAALKEARTWAAADLKPAASNQDRVASDVLAARASISGVSQTKADARQMPSPTAQLRMSDQEWNAFLEGQYASA